MRTTLKNKDRNGETSGINLKVRSNFIIILLFICELKVNFLITRLCGVVGLTVFLHDTETHPS